MLQTLFVIPYRVGDVPIFGFGVLLAIWAAACLIGFGLAIRRRGFSSEVRSYLPIALIIGLGIFFLPRVLPGGFPVRGYGMMMLAGVVSGVGLALYRAKQFGVNPEHILTLAFWMFISGILGARLFYVIQYREDFLRKYSGFGERVGAMLNFSEGGLVVYGSFIAVMIAVAVFVRKYQLPGLALCDLIAPCMLIGLAFGRIGCMLNGCCFAGVCETQWSVQFPWGSPPHERQAHLGLVDLHGIRFVEQGQAIDDLDAFLQRAPVIAEVTPNSPAAKAGFGKGDLIRVVSGTFQERDENGVLDWVADRREVKSVSSAIGALLRFHGDGGRIAIEAAAPQASTDSRPRIKTAEWALEDSPRSLPVHPVQLYSAIDALLICLFLIAYTPYRYSDGAVIGATLVIYAIVRFLEEDIRYDEPLVGITNLTISQNISLLVFAAGVVIWAHILTRPPRWAFPRAAD
jgi:phosphatidylglycerol---prolipoprotein diacylglyceryl transferase